MALMQDFTQPSSDVGSGAMDPTATALAFFVDKGYTPEQASGIVGNLLAESNLNTGAVGDGGISRGIAQWNRGRLANLQSFARASNADPNDLFTQLEFVHRELQGPEGAANRNLLRSNDPRSAALSFIGFERPQGWTAANPAGGHNASGRIANAEASLPLARELAQNTQDGALITAAAPQAGRQTAGSIGTGGGSFSGGLASDVLQGSSGADTFRSGMMAQPPADRSGDFNPGSIMQAIGMALMSGTRQNPLGNLPQIMMAQAKEQQAKADREYNRFKDQRNFDVSRQDATQAQQNTDRTFGLQSRQLDLSAADRAADNKRADAQFELQQRQALQPRIMQDGSGAIVAVPPDGSGVNVLQPGQRVMTEAGKVEERKRIAEQQLGLQPGSAGYDQYVANGKLPDGVNAPTTRTIKQADGSEVAVQWDSTSGKWVPLTAPEGGNAVRPSGAKFTEAQSKDLVFFNRGAEANDILGRHGSALQSGSQQMLSRAPGVGNYLTSEEFKQGNQAGKAFLTAILRKESGAVIGPQEEKNYGQIFLPQPGDPASVVKQKAEARQTALDSIRSGLGPAQAFARASAINPPQARTQADYDQLPPGATYLDPFGKRRVKKGGEVAAPTPEAGGQ